MQKVSTEIQNDSIESATREINLPTKGAYFWEVSFCIAFLVGFVRAIATTTRKMKIRTTHILITVKLLKTQIWQNNTLN